MRPLVLAIEVAIGGTLIAILLLVFVSILARRAGNPLTWLQDLAPLALAILTFVGAAAAHARGEHMAMKVLATRVGAARRVYLDALREWTVLLTSLAVLVESMPVLGADRQLHSATLNLPETLLDVPLAAGMALIAILALARLVGFRRRPTAAVGAGLGLLAASIYLFHGPLGYSLATDTSLATCLVVFFVLVVTGIPIAFAFALASTLFVYASGTAPATTVPLEMRDETANFVLLAVPFFVLAGFVMSEGGMTKPLAELVRALIGHVRGGLLQVVVVTMYVFSGLSGSKVADVVAVGTAMGGMSREEGYEPAELAAVLSASAVMGETVPPSIMMIILGSITTLSIGALFLGGLLPAALLAACLIVFIYIRARWRSPGPGKRFNPRRIPRAAVRAIPALLVPVILLAGIASGLATATEVSSFAVVYAVIVAIVVGRHRLGEIWTVVVDSAVMVGTVLFIVSAATSFSWSLSVANAPSLIGGMVTALGDRASFLVVSVAVLLVMGALLEGLPALLVFGPLLLPLAPRFGVDPLQYGLIMIIALGMGAFTPLVGVGSYVASAVSQTSIEKATPPMLAYLGVVLLGLVLVAAFPELSLFLPHRLMGH